MPRIKALKDGGDKFKCHSVHKYMFVDKYVSSFLESATTTALSLAFAKFLVTIDYVKE